MQSHSKVIPKSYRCQYQIKTRGLQLNQKFDYSFFDYKISIENVVIIAQLTICLAVSHFLWVVLSKSCAGLKEQPVHGVFHALVLIVFASQVLSEAAHKLLFGLQGRFIQLTKSHAIIQSNDVVRVAEARMERFITKEEYWNLEVVRLLDILTWIELFCFCICIL